MKIVKVILLCFLLISSQTAFAESVSTEELREAELLLQKASELSKAGKHDEAISNAERAVEIKERAFGKDHPGIKRSLNSLAVFYKAAGRHKDAENLYKRIRTMEQKGAFDSGLSQASQLADEHFEKAKQLYNQGRFLEACGMFEKSVVAEKNSPNPRGPNLSTELLGWAGNCYFNLGQYGKAIKYFEEALTISRKLGGDYKASTIFNNIGLVYHSWGQYDKALKYFEDVLTIERKSGREVEIATVLNNIGGVYDSWGQYDKALKYYEEALTIAKRLGGEDKIAMGINNIGTVYYSWGQYDKAIDYYEKALTIERKLGREDKIAILLSSIGMVYKAWGQYDKAIKYYEEALTINRKLGGEDKNAAVLSNIGMVYYSLKDYGKAVTYFWESVTFTEKLRKTAKGDIRRDYLESQLVELINISFLHTSGFLTSEMPFQR